MNRSIIKHPIISEKATRLSSLGKYIFLVRKDATAPEIKKTISRIYKVDVVSANVLNVKPKTRRLGQTVGTRSGYKKAVITLKKGQSLDILPQA
jgi:large subunit ribosomal protein L23